ncbi:MAG: glycine--tRNA ligase subunit beta [Rhodospirillales bacterium]|nr:glycine--tRNA ligase subunit beta [Rhodospirillales bacterium]
MAELLLELLSEEIPARMQARGAEDLKRLVCDGLKKAGLEFGAAQAFVTPRRLVLVVDGLPEKVPDISEERRGPRADAPEQAVAGFKGSLPEGTIIETRETDKGNFYFAQIEQKGPSVRDIIFASLPDFVGKLQWQKSMRWGSSGLRWVRPIRSIIYIFNGKSFDGFLNDRGFGSLELLKDKNLAPGNIPVGNITIGHRFLSPGQIIVTDFTDYKAKLEAAHVILDAAERRAKIEAGAAALAEEAGFKLKNDPGLLDEVAGLVEWPVVHMGAIDEAFMGLPDEVLTTSMRKHQKYFAVVDERDILAPHFIVVANTETTDGGKLVVAGNERVLRARLSDAKFFWDKDHEDRLDSRVQELGGRVFHAKLGTVLDKVMRVEQLVVVLAEGCGAKSADAERAAHLAKADLSTGMVTEFPDLQGIMGRYYALADGENPDIANAIAEHYSPQGPFDTCPTAPVSVAVALADKIDTLAGFWSIDEKPTGSRDPYALRRAALGVIRLILENKLRLSLLGVFGQVDLEFDGADLLAFFADRLKVHLRDQGVPHDHIDAVFALGGEDDLVRLLARITALGEFLKTEDGGNLLVAYRRAANILRIEEKKDGKTYNENPSTDLLQSGEEEALYEKLMHVGPKIAAAIEAEEFADAMRELASVREDVDAFFDTVTVNVDDAELRKNRLNMLSYVRRCLEEVADFSKLEGGDT